MFYGKLKTASQETGAWAGGLYLSCYCSLLCFLLLSKEARPSHRCFSYYLILIFHFSLSFFPLKTLYYCFSFTSFTVLFANIIYFNCFSPALLGLRCFIVIQDGKAFAVFEFNFSPFSFYSCSFSLHLFVFFSSFFPLTDYLTPIYLIHGM